MVPGRPISNPKHKPRRCLVAVVVLWLATGCAAAGMVGSEAGGRRPAASLRFYARVTEAVDAAAVGNAAAETVPGFCYLRSDRYLAALKDRLTNEKRREQWLEHLRRLDLQARSLEIYNLPAAHLARLAADMGCEPRPRAVIGRLQQHSRLLFDHDRLQPGYLASVRAAVRSSSEYVIALRVLGVYPVAALPVAFFTHRAYGKFASWHRAPAGALVWEGRREVYGPAPGATRWNASMERLFEEDNRDAFGLARLDVDERRKLAEACAPVLWQDTAGSYDRIGRVGWQGKQAAVDPAAPTVYYYFTQGLFRDRPALQVNYVLWYPERGGSGAPLIEHGRLDGLTVRLSLTPDGVPFMADVMNNCGCYHFFAPARRAVKGVVAQCFALDPFAPARLPEAVPRRRLGLRVNSGWHQVQRLFAAPELSETRVYRLEPYERLESLPRPDGSRASLFSPDGIARGSGRIEPLLFFPMGITDVGSMRQRGHHAIKLVGRAHFDDPDLFDRFFIYR